MFRIALVNGKPAYSKASFKGMSSSLLKVKILFMIISLGNISIYENPKMKLLIIFAEPCIGTEIRDNIVSEVKEAMILHKNEIRPLRTMFIAIFDARNTYFEVCMSPAFLDNL